MKKLISWIIITSVLLSVVPVYASLRGENCEDEAALLEALDILPDEAVSKLNADDEVTRAQFGEYLGKLLNRDENLVSEYKRTFTDFIAEDYLAKGVSDGYITGYPDGSFKPGENITLVEAEKMILDAAGYKSFINGTYPDSYAQLASERGLNKNVSKNINAGINLQDAIYLLYNMLNLEIPQINASGNKIIFEEDKTILTEKLGLKRISGIISANEKTSLSTPTGAGRNSVCIDGKIFDAGVSGAQKYLGYDVEIYYEYDDERIIYVNPSKRTTDMRIYAEELEGKNGNTYIYYSDIAQSKTAKAEIEPDADVIYNGKAMPVINDENVYLPKNGSITLIDNDRNGRYDVVIIEDRKILVLNIYDKTDNELIDKYDSNLRVNIYPEEKSISLNIRLESGLEIEADELKEWDVLEIAQSADGEVTDITVVRRIISGMIESIYTSQKGNPALKIDGKEYELSRTVTDYNSVKGKDFKISDTYSFILNSDGVIVGYYKNLNAGVDGEYGYYITYYTDENDENSLIVKLYTAEGKMKKYSTVSYKKFKIDGERFESIDAMKAYMPSNPVLAFYKTDKDGFIKEIDTTEKGTAERMDTLHLKASIRGMRYTLIKNNIDGKVTFHDNSIVFIVPHDPVNAPEKDFAVKPVREHFQHYVECVADGYGRNYQSPYSDVAVVVGEAENRINGSSAMYFVQGISSGLNEDDEEISILKLMSMNGVAEYQTSPDFLISDAKGFERSTKVGVELGDVIMFTVDNLGKINNINVFYRPSTDTFYPPNNPSSGIDYLNGLRVGLWDVFFKCDGFVRVVPYGSGFASSVGIENIEINNVYVYDPDVRQLYRKGSETEIRDYYNMGQASKVLIRTKDANTEFIVIYK